MGKEKNKRRELDNEAKVVLKNIRVSPQKLNLVAQMIRKETASKAFEAVSFLIICATRFSFCGLTLIFLSTTLASLSNSLRLFFSLPIFTPIA